MNSGSEERKGTVLRMTVVLGMIGLAAVLRILPHPWNFTPVGATALFSGAMVKDRRWALLFPLAALFAGDVFIGIHKLILVVYAIFLINVAIGWWLKRRRTVARIGGATLLGSAQFFVVTNFAVWAMLGSFPHTLAGLAACYLAGLPLFWNTLAGDAVYTAAMFGGFALAERMVPQLREAGEVKAR
jgi:Family of unknown function (DUF6580)